MNLNTLHNAVMDNDINEIDKCLSGGIDINAQDNISENTALIIATRYSNLDTIKYLINKGADPTIGDEDGWTPFYWLLIVDKKSKVDQLRYLLTINSIKHEAFILLFGDDSVYKKLISFIKEI